MRELIRGGTVPACIDVGVRGFEEVVYLHPAQVVPLHAHVIQSAVRDVRGAPGAVEQRLAGVFGDLFFN